MLKFAQFKTNKIYLKMKWLQCHQLLRWCGIGNWNDLKLLLKHTSLFLQSAWFSNNKIRSFTSQRWTLRSQDEPFGLLQNNISGTKHIGKIIASWSQSQRVAGVLTLHDSLHLRRDAIEQVHPSSSESPTVADSHSASQGYHTPSDSLQLASCRQSRRVASFGVS